MRKPANMGFTSQSMKYNSANPFTCWICAFISTSSTLFIVNPPIPKDISIRIASTLEKSFNQFQSLRCYVTMRNNSKEETKTIQLDECIKHFKNSNYNIANLMEIKQRAIEKLNTVNEPDVTQYAGRHPRISSSLF